MDPDDLREDIRAALDSRLVPSPGLEARVLAALPQSPSHAAQRAPAWPRTAGLAAVLLTLVIGGSLALWSRGLQRAPAGPLQPPASVRLAQFTSGSAGWVIVRQLSSQGIPAFVVTVNRTDDAGATWKEQLRLDGVQAGLRADPDGQHAVVWITKQIACPAPASPRPGSSASSGSCSEGSVLQVLQTADAGQHWTAVTPSTRAELGYFLDTRHGWVIASSAQAWTVDRTDDGGRTWIHVGQVEPMQVVTDDSLAFSDVDTGWLVLGGHAPPGHTGLLVTRDGGRTWNEVVMPTPTPGVTWQRAAQPPTLAGGQGVLPLLAHRDQPPLPTPAARTATPGTGLAAQADSINTVLLSTSADGGRTWTAPSPPATLAPASLPIADFFLDGRHWWLSSVPWTEGVAPGSGTLLVTSDGGATWKTYTTPVMVALSFVNDREGWAVATRRGAPYGLLHTTDGGATWTRVSVPPDPITGRSP